MSFHITLTSLQNELFFYLNWLVGTQFPYIYIFNFDLNWSGFLFPVATR